MSETPEVSFSPAPRLRWAQRLLVVAAILSLAWMFYYLRELSWQFEPWLGRHLAFLPAGGVKLVLALSGYAALLLPILVLVIGAMGIGLRMDVRRMASPRAQLEAIRAGHRQGAARWEAITEEVLKQSPDLSAAEAAQLRGWLAESRRRGEDEARRREKLYEENPALMENELRMAMESIRAKQRAGEP